MSSFSYAGTFLSSICWFLAAVFAQADDKSSAMRTPWTQSRIVGSPEAPEPYRIVNAFPHIRFQRPTSLEEIPGTNRLLVTEMAGKIFSFPKEAAIREAELLIDLQELLPPELANQAVSLFDAELHPQFQDTRYLFVCYVHPGQSRHTRVSRFSLTGDAIPKMVPGSEKVIITWPAGGHNGGCLEFGKDGYLFISTGDGSGPNPPDGLTTGQVVSDLLGAILRIDVNSSSAEQAYVVPADNPFVNQQGARPEIWAYGLRNPWKFGVDSQSGNIFAADNGWESWEMVHRIVPGGNCGWPVMEGRVALRTEVSVGPTPILPPVKDHPHTEANSVIGGPVYRGNKLPDLVGSFVYGDYITGTIWSIRPDRDGAYTHSTLLDSDQRIVAFTEGSRGELYVLDYDYTGQVYELLASNEPDRSAQFPRRLSETGLFSSLDDLSPAPGVVPYSVRVNRWMDGAKAQRWVAIPGSAPIQLFTNESNPSVFPDGTVFVKNVSIPQGEGRLPQRIETQLLHYENGVWRPYSYLWDESGREAHLVGSIGTDRPLRLPDSTLPGGMTERTWHVNAVNECKLCHDAAAKFVLGFTLHQLHRPNATDGREQLDQLADRGIIANPVAIAADDPARLVDPFDSHQKLDDRARSYLHANCSMCHHPGGNAIVSFYLRRDLPFERLNTNKGTGIGTFGMRDAKIISPGDPYRSVLLYRMSKLGYARMPYIGSQVVDSAGVALIEQWIRSLPPHDLAGLSAPVTERTAEFQALQTLSAEANRPPAQPETVVQALVKSTEGSLALSTLLHSKKVSTDVYRAAVATGARMPASDIRGLFEHFLPESQRRKTLGANILPDTILNLTGDHARGKLIYFSDNARCRACHQPDDRSQSIGPTLQEINKKYPSPAELLQHVLQPSLKIDEPFAAYAVSTDDGRVITGLLAEKSDEAIVLKTAEKQVVRIARPNIQELTKSDKSLMPERILSDLTAQEAADLFAYMRSLGSGN